MESIKSHCCRDYNSVTPSLPAQHPLPSLAPHPLHPASFHCTAVVYCCFHFSPAWGGDPVAVDCGRYVLVIWFGLLRTWVSEQPAFVDPSWTQTSVWMGNSLCQAGRKGHGWQASLLNWCDTAVCLSLTRYPSFLVHFFFTNLESICQVYSVKRG